MILLFVAGIFLAFVVVGALLYLVYRETEVDFPPRHCVQRHAVMQ